MKGLLKKTVTMSFALMMINSAVCINAAEIDTQDVKVPVLSKNEGIELVLGDLDYIFSWNFEGQSELMQVLNEKPETDELLKLAEDAVCHCFWIASDKPYIIHIADGEEKIYTDSDFKIKYTADVLENKIFSYDTHEDLSSDTFYAETNGEYFGFRPLADENENITLYNNGFFSSIDEIIQLSETPYGDIGTENDQTLNNYASANTVYGDLNSDSKIDVTDLSELSLALADGKVTLSDLARMRQYLSKIITSFG